MSTHFQTSPGDCTFAGVDACQLQPDECTPARTVMHDDFVRRCALHHRAAAYVISGLLHPCFKDYAFIDYYSFVDSSDMAWALTDAALGVAHGVEAQAPHHRHWAV